MNGGSGYDDEKSFEAWCAGHNKGLETVKTHKAWASRWKRAAKLEYGTTKANESLIGQLNRARAELETRGREIQAGWEDRDRLKKMNDSLGQLCREQREEKEAAISRIQKLESRLALADRVVEAARAANAHWNEFGPEYDLDRQMDALHRMLEAYDKERK